MSVKLETGGLAGLSKLWDYMSLFLHLDEEALCFSPNNSFFFFRKKLKDLKDPESISTHWNFNPAICSVIAEVRNTMMINQARSFASSWLSLNSNGDQYLPLRWKWMCCWVIAVNVITYHPSCTFPPNTGCEAFLFELVSCVGGRKLSLCAHGCLEHWNNTFPLSAVVSGPQTWADKERMGSHYQCTYVTVIPFLAADFWPFLLAENWLTPEPPHLLVSFAWSVWWILWIQTLTKPDDHSLLMSWILRNVTPPRAAPKPAAQKLTKC